MISTSVTLVLRRLRDLRDAAHRDADCRSVPPAQEFATALGICETVTPMRPDLIIAFGPRSVLSFVGFVLVIVGVWHVDRTWDEEGSAAYERAKQRDPSSVKLSDEQLDRAFRFPFLFLGGWMLFGLAYLFPDSGDFSLELSSLGLLSLLAALVLAAVGSLPMAEAVRYRQAKKKQILSMLFLIFWILLTIITALGAENTLPTFVLSLIHI